MKIAVVAANGKAGKLIVEEAVNRGHSVCAIVRGENETKAQEVIAKDAMNLSAEDLEGFDVVIDAVGGWTPETVGAVPDVAKHLAGLLAGSQTRLLVVGGAGSLFMDPEHTTTVAQAIPFPEEAMPVLEAHAATLEFLRSCDDVRWTYVSPAGDFQAEGERKGTYALGGEELLVDEAGESKISYADYAIAMIDEAEKAQHVQQRFTVAWA